MKIGLFDSGLGGLIITKSVIGALPQYDYVYLGDTARVPYGNRSQDIIYQFTRSGVEYLFAQDCGLVILACNTASAEALMRIQHDILPAYPGRRVLGVLVPAAEETAVQTKTGRVGILATQGTVASGAYVRELHKLAPQATITQQAAPLLVPLVENNALQYASPILDDYLAPLLAAHIDTLVLGCTHYPLFKQQLQAKLGPAIRIVSQDDCVPPRLADYLRRHSSFDQQLTRTGTRQFLMTDITPSTRQVAMQLFGQPVQLRHVSLS